MNDLYMSNSISKCFEFKEPDPAGPSIKKEPSPAAASIDILVEYCMSLPRSDSLNNILT